MVNEEISNQKNYFVSQVKKIARFGIANIHGIKPMLVKRKLKVYQELGLEKEESKEVAKEEKEHELIT